VAAPIHSMVGAVGGVVGGPKPSSTSLLLPLRVQMRATSPEIQEPGESSGSALLRDVRGSDARVLKLASVL
jgi:hypothetical protein